MNVPRGFCLIFPVVLALAVGLPATRKAAAAPGEAAPAQTAQPLPAPPGGTAKAPADVPPGASEPGAAAGGGAPSGEAPSVTEPSEPPPPAPNLSELAAASSAPESEPAGAAGAEWSTTAPAPADEPAGTDWPFVGGIVALVGGAAALAVGHYAMFRLADAVREDDMKNYKKGVPEGESSCEAARAGFVSTAEGAPSPDAIVDLCDEAEALEIVQYVFLPVGAASIIAGLFLVGTSDTVNRVEPTEARSWRLRVGASPYGGAASLELTWF